VLTLTNARIREALAALGYPAPAPGQLHLLGVRGAVPVSANVLRPGANHLDRYDDSLVLFGTTLHAYRATVDPGKRYTDQPQNAAGCAHLVNGYWRYQRGLHKGIPALIQAAPVTVRRDRDRDGDDEAGEPVETGMFGINLHPGGNGAQPVGPWSAGCQVIPREGWPSFWEHVLASGQRHFGYWLLDAKDLS
jgi:hypothetical protein